MRLAILVLLLALSAPVPRPAPSNEWPLERIIANLEARVRETPDDARAHYNLGRAHAFAFALERSSLLATGTEEPNWVRDLDRQRRHAATAPTEKEHWFDQVRLDLPPPSPVELLQHLEEGVRNLLRACELDSAGDTGSYRFDLTTGWLLETGAHLASRVDTAGLFAIPHLGFDAENTAVVQEALTSLDAGDPRSILRDLLRFPLREKAASFCAQHAATSRSDLQARVDSFLRRYWIEQAIEHYRLACSEPVSRMIQANVADVRELSAAGEALESYLRLVRERGFLDDAEESAARGLETSLARLEGLPQSSSISPMLLALDGCHALDDLIAPHLTVPFDLDGDAIDELWPWIAPGTGWLVWDPHRRGEITSGQQLFGTASAWLFFDDGYRVLDALDDDRDGRIAGAELAGMAVWFDRDTDGVSDPGEVVAVEKLRIVALATEATERIGASLGNPCGVELADGRVLPTYDWVLEPATP